MAKAQAVVTTVELEVSRAGDAMMMLISRSVWETMRLQAEAEGVEPGEVLSKALTQYLEAHGSERARQYLASLKKEAGRAAG